ncbi:hypothetical protein ACXX9E_29440 [Pseudomonas sp. GNP014]
MGEHHSRPIAATLVLRGFDGSAAKHCRNNAQRDRICSSMPTSRIDKQADGSLKLNLKDGPALEVDCAFYATGPRPMLDNLAGNTDVQLNDREFIEADEEDQPASRQLETGHVIVAQQFDPWASPRAWWWRATSVQAEQDRRRSDKMILTAVFSLPSIGTVGAARRRRARRLRRGHQRKAVSVR